MTKKIILGGGCFWCIEATYQQVEGIEKVVSGYSGGKDPNPTYREVCGGETGHAEGVELTYEDSKINLEKILEIFWKVHDPTTLNRQGHDVGSQYRSVIYYLEGEQKTIAEKSIKELSEAATFANPIVTEVKKLDVFYKAEDYHQDYFNKHPGEGYCQVVIRPKLEKLGAYFKK